MSGYSDLTPYETDDERNAVCAELARMLRIVPLNPLAATANPELSPWQSAGLLLSLKEQAHELRNP